jgi:hypothetical protein
VLVLSLAAAAFAASFIGLARVGASIPLIAVLFALGGIGIRLGETAQSAAIATHSLDPGRIAWLERLSPRALL